MTAQQQQQHLRQGQVPSSPMIRPRTFLFFTTTLVLQSVVVIVDAFMLGNNDWSSKTGSNFCNVAGSNRWSSPCQEGRRISLNGIANSNNDDTENDDGGGAALAAEFAQFMNKRDEMKKKKQQQSSNSNKGMSSSSLSSSSQASSSLPPQQPQEPPFSKRKEVRVDKATGKPYDVPSSTKKSFLSSQNNLPYGSFGSFDNTRDPRSNMLPVSRMTLNSDELRLVRRAELALIAQLVGGIVLLFALLAIGTSGGITDGSDRFSSTDFEADMTPDYSIVTDGSDIVPERLPSPSTTSPTTTPFDEGLWI